MVKWLIVVLCFYSIKIGTQPRKEQELIIHANRIELFSNYLFGEKYNYDIFTPYHQNWGGLRRQWTNSQAWDIFVEPNTPVYSIIEGVVFSTRFRENGKTVWGHNIIIENINEKVFYTHLDEVILCPGDSVELGQLVGYVGKWPNRYRFPDGSHMPSHLHIAIYRHRLNRYLDGDLRISPSFSKYSMRGLINI